MHLQVVFFHHHAGPHQVQQFVLADHALAARHQGQQQVKGARSHRHRLAAYQQLASRGPQHAAAECQVRQFVRRVAVCGGAGMRHGRAVGAPGVAR
jgi:hypothetical protein